MAPPFKNLKKVAITGYDGFTGTYLAKALRLKDYIVCGIVNRNPENNEEYQADVTNLEELLIVFDEIRPDYVVHLASITNVEHQQEKDFYEVNLFGTLNLLKAIQKLNLKIKKILISSSANVYGNSPMEYLDEKVCPLPVNHYANSKLAMENMVRTWFELLPIIITRPFNYTGPGQPIHSVIPKIVYHYQGKKAQIELGDIEVIRDFSDVRFVVESYIKLIESTKQSEIFNICSGIGHSICSIIKIMDQISGYKMQILQDSGLLRKNDIKKLIGVNHKLLNAVGKIKIYPLEETLINMYNSRE